MKEFKIGDRIKVVKKVEEEEGWDDLWVDYMDGYIGKEGEINNILGKRIYIRVEAHPLYWTDYNFPPSSLELVENA